VRSITPEPLSTISRNTEIFRNRPLFHEAPRTLGDGKYCNGPRACVGGDTRPSHDSSWVGSQATQVVRARTRALGVVNGSDPGSRAGGSP
jgi:hypothetical protein